MFLNFFEWFKASKNKKISVKNLDENIFSLMETMNQSWIDIMYMSYPDFEELLEWKSKLEEKRRTRMEEKIRISKKNQEKNKSSNLPKSKR